MNLLFNQNPPQLILVLGGDIDREKIGIKLAKDLNLPITISGGSNIEYSDWLIAKEGLNKMNVTRDYRAKDTLTNFTSVIDDIEKNNINHIFLITSSDHIKRARIVGNIIAGSRGIKITGIEIPCNNLCKEESSTKQYIDAMRAISWVTIKKDPKAILNRYFNNDLLKKSF